MQPKETIVIYADYGMCPYAWRKKSSDMTSYVGGNIADAYYGLSKVLGTSTELDKAFSAWIHLFNQPDAETTLDWNKFHYNGIELAQRLKAELGDRFEVEYYPPFEDPVRHGRPITRIVTPEYLYVYEPISTPEKPSVVVPLIETISVELSDCHVGWIRMNLIVGYHKLRIRMTHWDDPIDSFIFWMEEIIAGKECCTMSINEEGQWKILTAIQKSDALLILHVEHSDLGERETLLEKRVHRRQLVEALYGGLQDFGKSPEYIPREWEHQSLGGWLAERTESTEEEVLETLVSLKGIQLNPLLLLFSYLDEGGDLYEPVQKMRSIDEMLAHALSANRSELESPRVRYGNRWGDVEDDYIGRREIIRDEFLSEQVSRFEGTTLRYLYSEKLETYLSSDRDRQIP